MPRPYDDFHPLEMPDFSVPPPIAGGGLRALRTPRVESPFEALDRLEREKKEMDAAQSRLARLRGEPEPSVPPPPEPRHMAKQAPYQIPSGLPDPIPLPQPVVPTVQPDVPAPGPRPDRPATRSTEGAGNAAQAFGRGFERNAGEAVGGTVGLWAGAKGGAALGTAVGAMFGGVGAPVGAAAGGLIGGLLGMFGGGWLGKQSQKAVMGEEAWNRAEEQYQRDMAAHPNAALLGSLAPHLATLAVSPGGALKLGAKGAKAADAARAGSVAWMQAGRAGKVSAEAMQLANEVKTTGEAVTASKRWIRMTRAAVEAANKSGAAKTKAGARVVESLSGRILAYNTALEKEAAALAAARKAGVPVIGRVGQARVAKASLASKFAHMGRSATDYGEDGEYNAYAPEVYATTGDRLLSDAEVAWAAAQKGEKGFINQLATERVADPDRLIGSIPFLGSWHNAAKQRDLEARRKRLADPVAAYGVAYHDNPQYLRDRERVIADENARRIDEAREQTVRGIAGQIIGDMPAFMVEIANTPELGNLGAARGALARVGGGMLQAAIQSNFQPGAVAANYERNHGNEWTITEDEWGALNLAVERAGNSTVKAMWKGWAQNAVEYVSEVLGEYMQGAVAAGGRRMMKAKSAMPKKLGQFFAEVFGDTPAIGRVRGTLRAGAVQPFFESLEERAGDFLKAALFADDREEGEGYWQHLFSALNPGWQQWLAEQLAFLPLGGVQIAGAWKERRRLEREDRGGPGNTATPGATGATPGAPSAPAAAPDAAAGDGGTEIPDETLVALKDRLADFLRQRGAPEETASAVAAAESAADIHAAMNEMVCNAAMQALRPRLTGEQWGGLQAYRDPRQRLAQAARFVGRYSELDNALLAASAALENEDAPEDLLRRTTDLLVSLRPEWRETAQAAATPREALMEVAAQANAELASGTLDPADPRWKDVTARDLAARLQGARGAAEDARIADLAVEALVEALPEADRAAYDALATPEDRAQWLDMRLRDPAAALNADLAVGRHIARDGIDAPEAMLAATLGRLKDRFAGAWALAGGDEATGSPKERLAALVAEIDKDEANKRFLEAFAAQTTDEEKAFYEEPSPLDSWGDESIPAPWEVEPDAEEAEVVAPAAEAATAAPEATALEAPQAPVPQPVQQEPVVVAENATTTEPDPAPAPQEAQETPTAAESTDAPPAQEDQANAAPQTKADRYEAMTIPQLQAEAKQRGLKPKDFPNGTWNSAVNLRRHLRLRDAVSATRTGREEEPPEPVPASALPIESENSSDTPREGSNGPVRRTPTEAEMAIIERVKRFARSIGVTDVVLDESDDEQVHGWFTAERDRNGDYTGKGVIHLANFKEGTIFHEIAHALWFHVLAKEKEHPRMALLMRQMRAIAASAPDSVYDAVLKNYAGVKNQNALLSELFAHYIEADGGSAWLDAVREQERPWIVRILHKISEVLESAAHFWLPGMKSKYRDVRTGLRHIARDLANGREVDIEGLLSAAEDGAGKQDDIADEVASMPVGQVRRELVKRELSPIGAPATIRERLRGKLNEERATAEPTAAGEFAEPVEFPEATPADAAPVAESAPILSGDEVRKTMPGYDPANWRTHVDCSGYVGPRMEARFQELLKTRKGKGNGEVVFLAGGNGVGKSTVAGNLGETPDFIIDSTLGNLAVARKQIDAILANGQKPVIFFVYRTPEQALEAIQGRVENGGHAVSPLSFADSHTKSLENLRLLSDEYGDKVGIHIVDNSVEGVPEITLEQLEAKGKPNHAAIRKRANEVLGRYQGALGGDAGAPSPDKGGEEVKGNESQPPDAGGLGVEVGPRSPDQGGGGRKGPEGEGGPRNAPAAPAGLETPPAGGTPAQEDLSAKTADELRAIAKGLGIKTGGMNKARLLAEIGKKREVGENAPAEKQWLNGQEGVLTERGKAVLAYVNGIVGKTFERTDLQGGRMVEKVLRITPKGNVRLLQNYWDKDGKHTVKDREYTMFASQVDYRTPMGEGHGWHEVGEEQESPTEAPSRWAAATIPEMRKELVRRELSPVGGADALRARLEADDRDAADENGETLYSRSGAEDEEQRQRDAVVSRYTTKKGGKKDGWLKAPNGQPTKLSESRWVEVRTENFKREHGDWESLAIRRRLDEAPVAKVEVGAFKKMPGLNARQTGVQLLSTPAYHDTPIGRVVIDGRSAHASLGHNYGPAKLDVLVTLQRDFANAVYLGFAPDFEGKPLDNHYFAYPVEYGDGRHLVFCRVRKDHNANRLYVHEVFTEEEIKGGDALQTAARPGRTPRGSIAFARNFLRKLYSVKPESVTIPLDENGEPAAPPGETLFSRSGVEKDEVDRWFKAKIVERRRGGRVFYDIKSGKELIGQGYRSRNAALYVIERERSLLDRTKAALAAGGLDAKRLANISDARRLFIQRMKEAAADNAARADAFEQFAQSLGLHKSVLEKEWKIIKGILTADGPAQGELRASDASRIATTVLARASIRAVALDMEKFFKEKLDKDLPAGGMRRNVLVGLADARAAMKRKTTPEEIRRKIDAAEARKNLLDNMLQSNEDASGNPLSEEERKEVVREEAEKSMELRILRAFEGLEYNHDAKSAASLLSDLDAWNNARMELEAIAKKSMDDIAREEAELSEQAANDRAIVMEELTDGQPIPTSSEQHALNLQHPVRRKLFDTMRGWFAGILGGGSAWGEFLTRKKGVGYMQGHAAKLLHEGAAAGQDVEDTMNEEDGRHFIDVLNRFTKKNLDPEHSIKDMTDWSAYCSELYLERKENDIRFRKVVVGTEEDPTTGEQRRVAHIVPGEHCHYSIDELMHIYLVGLQAQEAAGQAYTDLPRKRKGVDTSLMESMLKGGYSAQTMAEITAVLEKGGYDEMAKAISEDMERKAPLLDRLMERIFHSRLKRVSYYCPLRRTHYGLLEKGSKASNGTGEFMSIVRSFLKERVSNHKDIKPTHLISAWQSHNRQSNHIIAHADWISRMARIFRNQEIQGAMDWVLGTKVRQMFNSWLDIQARGGSVQFDSGIADEIGRTFARVQTQTPRVAIKQTTSATAAIPYLPEWASLAAWHADLAKIIINGNLRRNFLNMLKNESPAWRMRGITASDIQAMAARENAARTKPGRIYRIVGTKLNRKLGAMTSLGDKTGAVLGCYGIYRAWERKLLGDGKSPEEAKRVALAKFVEAMNGSQQSAVPEYMSHYQSLGNAYRFLSMFMSAQIAMTRNYILKARACKQGRISRLDFAKTVYGITTAQFLFNQAAKLFRPGLLTLAGVAGWMLGHSPDPDDDDDEHPAWETLKDGAHALLATPFSGLFILGPAWGEVVQYIINREGYKMGLEKRKPRAPEIASALLPAAESLEDLVPLVLDAPEQIMGLGKMSPDERERFLRKAADAISLAAGNSLPKVLAEAGAGAYDAWTADDLDLLQKVGRGLSFSRSAMDAPKRKPPKKQEGP